MYIHIHIYIHIYIYVLDLGRVEGAVHGGPEDQVHGRRNKLGKGGEYRGLPVLPQHGGAHRSDRTHLQVVECEVDPPLEQLGSSSKDVRYFCQNLPCPLAVDL
jgi:hypothetical protein